MAHPKRRHSNQRTRKRRTHHKAPVAALSICPNCHAPKRAHYICAACGHYKGKPVITVKQRESSPKA